VTERPMQLYSSRKELELVVVGQTLNEAEKLKLRVSTKGRVTYMTSYEHSDSQATLIPYVLGLCGEPISPIHQDRRFVALHKDICVVVCSLTRNDTYCHSYTTIP